MLRHIISMSALQISLKFGSNIVDMCKTSRPN